MNKRWPILTTGLFALASCEGGASDDSSTGFARAADAGDAIAVGGAVTIDGLLGPVGGVAADSGARPVTDGESPAAAIAGRWALRQVTVSDVDLPVLGTTRTATVSILRVDIVGGAMPGPITFRAEVCGITIGEPSDPARTVVPEPFVRSLPVTERQGALGPDGAFGVESLTQVHGARLDDLETEALPTAPDDPRVFDQDADGRPGLTVRIAGLVDGEIYVAQRGRDRLDGRFDGVGVDGRLTWSSEQVVLDADVDLLKMPVASRAVADPSLHVFALRRVAADATCEEILDDASALFEES